MKNITLKLAEKIDYVVGKSGLGSYLVGDIVKAYKVETYDNNDGEFLIYHPSEDGRHEVGACIDVCRYYGLSDTYRPIENKSGKSTYFNLE